MPKATACKEVVAACGLVFGYWQAQDRRRT